MDPLICICKKCVDPYYIYLYIINGSKKFPKKFIIFKFFLCIVPSIWQKLFFQF